MMIRLWRHNATDTRQIDENSYYIIIMIYVQNELSLPKFSPVYGSDQKEKISW